MVDVSNSIVSFSYSRSLRFGSSEHQKYRGDHCQSVSPLPTLNRYHRLSQFRVSVFYRKKRLRPYVADLKATQYSFYDVGTHTVKCPPRCTVVKTFT